MSHFVDIRLPKVKYPSSLTTDFSHVPPKSRSVLALLQVVVLQEAAVNKNCLWSGLLGYPGDTSV